MSEKELVHSAPHHPDDAHAGAHGTHATYMIGFALSVFLTAIPFWLVMGDVFRSSQVAGVVIMAFAAVQIVVHMVYFLHMNRKSEGGWILMSLLFTGIIIVIALVGSLWVMHHLDANMMPMSPEQMRVAP